MAVSFKPIDYNHCLDLLPQPSASVDNTNLCLNNSSYSTRPHSIIVYYSLNALASLNIFPAGPNRLWHVS